MAVQFNNDTAYWSRTGISLVPPFSVCALVRPTLVSAWKHMLNVAIGPLITDGNEAIYIFNANTGALVTARSDRSADGGFNFASLSATALQWYFVAFAVTAADHKVANGHSMLWESSSFDSESGRTSTTDNPTMTTFHMGALQFGGGDLCNAAIEDVRLWSGVELSGSDFLAEKASATPVITGSLYAWYPCLDATGADSSGNGRNLTTHGSVTVVAGPRNLSVSGNAAAAAVGSAVNGRSILIRG